jgi:CubicO group peptidase (beta-lactamase class C family)
MGAIGGAGAALTAAQGMGGPALAQGRPLSVDGAFAATSAPAPGELAPAGFPPVSPTTVSNWQDPSRVRWSFSHLREILPTQLIQADPTTTVPLPQAHQPVGHIKVNRLNGSTASLDQVLADTHTDAFLIMHNGRVVDERYFGETTASTRHLVMSVSKSMVGCVAARLVESGGLDPNAKVTTYVPEVAGSGYQGATVRNLLDMRTGVAFRETYADLDAEVRVMERSVGWRPIKRGDPVGNYAFLKTLGTAGPHGKDFTYRSADNDMLGWVCERVADTRMADLISAYIWAPMGAQFDAEVACDPVGTAVHDGGVCATARDLARFGQMLLQDGLAGGRRVVSSDWLADAYHPGADVRAAFAASENEPVLPGGWYRNQFWFIPGLNGVNLVCLGIHGQMVHVNPATQTVTVKVSSWPEPQNLAYLVDTLRAFGVAGAYLAELDAIRPPASAATPKQAK